MLPVVHVSFDSKLFGNSQLLFNNFIVLESKHTPAACCLVRASGLVPTASPQGARRAESCCRSFQQTDVGKEWVRILPPMRLLQRVRVGEEGDHPRHGAEVDRVASLEQGLAPQAMSDAPAWLRQQGDTCSTIIAGRSASTNKPKLRGSYPQHG